MNLILLSPADFIDGKSRVRLSDRRFRHVVDVLKSSAGETLAVGLVSGLMGQARVVVIGRDNLELDVTLDTPPPAKLPVILCVALMRPPVLKRVLQTACAMGVPEIHIFHSRRVEKSFWQSTALREAEIRHELMLGLEQAKDTVLPTVVLHKRFRPFAEDVVPGLIKGREGLVADPAGVAVESLTTQDTGHTTHESAGGQALLSSCVKCRVPCVVIIGPEGGLIPFEVEKFREAGCRIVSLGERLLRVETAVVTFLAKFA